MFFSLDAFDANSQQSSSQSNTGADNLRLLEMFKNVKGTTLVDVCLECFLCNLKLLRSDRHILLSPFDGPYSTGTIVFMKNQTPRY